MIVQVYETLFKEFGPQNWWPVTAEGSQELEIIFGAILTQNTTWKNAEKAILNLRDNDLISITGIKNAKKQKLARLIRSSGYFNQKAERLKTFAGHVLQNYGGDVQSMLSDNIKKLRAELVSIKGIGKETADSIILYAAKKPIFVIDAYTRRIFSRIGLCAEDTDYDSLQRLFHNNLQHNEKKFNEYHALLVKLGKETCTKNPKCGVCPLNKICRTGKAYISGKS